jgi:hypothetical protein
LIGCSAVPTVPQAVRTELAPTGKLRVGLIMSNQVLVSKDSRTGEIRGVTVETGQSACAAIGRSF